MKSVAETVNQITDWQPPVIPEDIVHGDMPGDKVDITREHVQKANIIFRELLPKLAEASEKSDTGKVVITVCGGSGVWKIRNCFFIKPLFKGSGNWKLYLIRR